MAISSIRVLVADDDPDALDLLTYQLKGEDFKLDLHNSAEDLLGALNDRVQDYDVVLLDLNMPGGMSGMECLKTIKANPRFKNLPVVLQTSDNDIPVITEALSAGAYYFLEKTPHREIIQSVLLSAMEYKVRIDEIENERTRLKSGMRFTDYAKFSIRTLDDMNSLTALLCSAYPDPDRVTIGIHELLTNAIEHGNLGITYEDKSMLIMEDKWKKEVEDRLNMDEHKDKRVEVEIEQTSNRIVLTITDRGDGFDCENYLEIDPARLFDPHGRGIAVAKSMSFDELAYIGCGNQVVATVNL